MHFLELDGVTGPTALADVETSDSSSRTGSSLVAPLTLMCPLGMPRGFQDWVTRSMGGRASFTSGKITQTDYNFRSISILEFRGAKVGQIRFPAPDAASSDVGILRVSLAVDSMKQRTGRGELLRATRTGSKTWLCSNFRFEMGNLPTESVDRIGSVTVSPPGAPESFGIRIRADDAKPFEDAARRGLTLPTSLDFLQATLSDTLLTLRFPSARIARVTMESRTATDDALAKADVLISPGTAFLEWGG
ncbi:MAG: hypothetical protein PVI57_10225 [Gemmatimonadota bacterium]|jgi:hypothetical protein